MILKNKKQQKEISFFWIILSFFVFLNISAPKQINDIPLNQEEKNMFEQFFLLKRNIVKIEIKQQEREREILFSFLKIGIATTLIGSGNILTGSLMLIKNLKKTHDKGKVFSEIEEREREIKQKQEDIKIFLLAIEEIKKSRKKILFSIKEQNKLFQKIIY